MFFSLKAAARFIYKSIVQNFVIFLAIFIGIGVQFFILTLSSSLKNLLIDSSFKYKENVILERVETKNTPILLNEVQQHDDVEMALLKVALRASISLEKEGDLKRYPFVINVVSNTDDPSIYQRFYGVGIEETLVSGRINDPYTYEIMLNDNYAKSINAQLGDTILLHYKTLVNPVSFLVVGTFDNGMFSYNYNYSYINKDLLNIRVNQYHLYIKLHDPLKSTEFSKEYADKLKDKTIKITDWQERDQRLIQMQIVQKAVIGTIEVLISIAIFIVVLNMLNYIIQSKYKEIGIFKAMGLNKNSLKSIFLFQTLIITVLASILGLIGGRIAIEVYARIMTDPLTNEQRFIYKINEINYISLFFLSIFTSLLATLTSFRKINKLSIIELIKL